MNAVTLLLPAVERFGGQAFGPQFATALGRADALPMGEPGRRAQVLRHVQVAGDRWPIAALSRQSDVGDAAGSAWLRADPAWLRPDINGVRLMAYGPALAPNDADVEALLPALRPLFGDAGFELDAPTPSRWYVRASAASRLPAFPDPAEVVGGDLFEFDEREDTPEARRWRALATEVQIVLHNHPWNQRRAERGQAPINALWFWGAGALPAAGAGIRSAHALTCTDDPALHALATTASHAIALPAGLDVLGEADGSLLVDLAQDTDLRRIEHDWLQPALMRMARGRIAGITLDAEDGRRWHLARGQRWRVWRRPRPRLGA